MSYMFHYCTTTYDYAKTVVDFLNQEMKPMVAADRNLNLHYITVMILSGTQLNKQLSTGFKTKAYQLIS